MRLLDLRLPPQVPRGPPLLGRGLNDFDLRLVERWARGGCAGPVGPSDWAAW